MSVYPKVRGALLNSLLLISLTSFDSLLKVSKLVVLLTLFYHLQCNLGQKFPPEGQGYWSLCSQNASYGLDGGLTVPGVMLLEAILIVI